MTRRFQPCRILIPAAALIGFLSSCRSVTPTDSESDFGLTSEESAFASALAHYGQALLYEAEEGYRTSKAYDAFRRAADADPAQHRLNARAAVAAMMRREPEEAFAVLERSQALNPDSLEAAVDLAKIYRAAGRSADAIRQYERAGRLAPDNPAIPVELATLLFQLKRDGEALDVLRRAMRRPDQRKLLASFCYRIGAEFAGTQQLERAVPCLRLAAEGDPAQHAVFHQVIGEIYETMGRRAEALEAYRAATRADPPLPQSYVRIAMLRADTEPLKALAVLREAAARLPDSPAITLAAAYMHTRQNNPAAALAGFDRLWALPGLDRAALSEPFFLHYAILLEQADRWPDAEAVLRESLTYHAGSADTLNYLAYSWAERATNLDEAESFVTRALDAEPDNGAYIDTLGWIQYRQGRLDDALQTLQCAFDRMPQDSTIAQHIGAVLSALGREAEADVYRALSRMLSGQDENKDEN
jgi:tetratricopeptide (TPR) repeat protein